MIVTIETVDAVAIVNQAVTETLKSLQLFADRMPGPGSTIEP